MFKSRDKVKLKDEVDLNNLPGNFSGEPCWSSSNNLLAKSYQEFKEDFKFIGVGGVFNAEDAYTKITLGASLVEIGTGVIFQGPAGGSVTTRHTGVALRSRPDLVAPVVGSIKGDSTVTVAGQDRHDYTPILAYRHDFISVITADLQVELPAPPCI